MRVLLVDTYGTDGMLDYAMRCQSAGHVVKWFFPKTERTRDNGKGLVETVNDWREWARWADIIILADNTKYLREVDAWRKSRGVPVIGATTDSAALELDRTYGQKMLKRCGIATVPYREFSKYDPAIAYVKREMRRFVSKPCGDEPDKALSYVAKSPADLVYMLERWKKAQKLKGDFILQDFVPGIEMAVGAWIGPNGFLPGWCENFEFKALMAGDRGPNTGEMGTIVRYVKASKLADRVLKPCEDMLVQLGHTGYVDVNCIIDERGNPWPLEWTMRMGWPTFNIQAALHEGDPVEWLAHLSSGHGGSPQSGHASQPFRMNKVAAGVVLAIPDFPYSHATKKEVQGVPIYGLKGQVMEDTHLCQAMMADVPQEVNGKIVTASCITTAGDYVLVTTGVGDSVRDARSRAYRVMEKLTVPSSPFWRPDIGQRLKKQLPELQAMGYATNLAF